MRWAGDTGMSEDAQWRPWRARAPNSKLQGTSLTEFMAGMDRRMIAVIGILAPFAVSTKEQLDAVLPQ